MSCKRARCGGGTLECSRQSMRRSSRAAVQDSSRATVSLCKQELTQLALPKLPRQFEALIETTAHQLELLVQAVHLKPSTRGAA